VFQLVGRELEKLGFERTYTEYLWTVVPSPFQRGGFSVRALWKRNSSNAEDLVAIGLLVDEERFDFSAWVCSSAQDRVEVVRTELAAVDGRVVDQMAKSFRKESKREDVEHYRDNLKELGPYGSIPAFVSIASGLLPSYLGLPPTLTVGDFLPLVFGVALVFTVAMFGLGIFYVLRIIAAEMGH